MSISSQFNHYLNPEEKFFDYKENTQGILREINSIATLMSLLKLATALGSSQAGLFTPGALFCYSIPLFLCLVTHYCIQKNQLVTATFLSFYLIPASVLLLRMYEPTTLLILYPFASSVVAFFILNKKIYLIISYIISALTVFFLCLADALSQEANSSELALLVTQFLIFYIPFFFVLWYLRHIIEHNHKSIRKKRNQLALQNEILEKQNRELIDQEHLLAIKNQSLIESADFQNKIIAILSHDIRVPLATIRTILRNFSNNQASDKLILKSLPEIEENINYLYGLFDDMMTWSKEQKITNDSEKKQINLNELANEICYSYSGASTSKTIQIQNKIPSDKQVYANERYLKVILRNLISNAVKFTEKGGCICIDINKKNDYEIVSVENTGQGINKEDLHKIRQGLRLSNKGTLNETGTGIGLYFCREFAEKCGGELQIESEPGKGSVFSFSLPAA
ncbi:MAG: HAMP domain-containing sensor histidine kinase [Chitinophagaceae bacterium]